MTAPSDHQTEIVFMSEGPVPDSTRDQAQRMVEKLADISPRPVIFARIKVLVDEDRDPGEHVVVQGTVDVSGSLIRAQASASTPRQALGIAEARLERRLNRLRQRRKDAAKRPHAAPPGVWRSGDLPSERPGYYERPPEEREIVRRKTYAPEDISIDEALFDLDVLDYRFFLFTDKEDHKPSVVYEDGDEVFLRKIDGSHSSGDTAQIPIEVNDTPAPSIGVEDAIGRLDVSDEPFIFFEDSKTGEACVLYRRYDGHYGLIVPASSEH